ncbi:MAG: xylose isomerase [Fervidobacterium sp.]|uniref:Xylose isomerase n=2 Tax=Fervidobacterium gondwanense TaxID=44754 RepID=XYLA_FERGO|nr:xylose isomerase [Fervidobacterium gondwanense]Q6T6K9.1 RecName: Full=Xylose isomerase [Fervidobacterium gondwanense]AAR07504.1 glucose isomerase [Fervidobacterium gondwanense]UXF00344.1 xylose isomerase [Fervidobacterium riparium]SHN48851.1 D-xylose isomerase [Fervidobacterium gondwanense DSM 13020]
MYFNVEKVVYEGPSSKNLLAYKFYNPEEEIAGKKMRDWFRFAVAYWHTFNSRGEDPFGSATFERPWFKKDPMDTAFAKVDALFEFCEKTGVEYFTFHDRDLAHEGLTLRESNKILDKVVEKIKEYMKSSNVKLLWGTANLFSHPRYAQGAATSPNPLVFSYAASQVKKMLDVTKELGGLGYVLWGGREGYDNLLLTDSALEEKLFARFLEMVVEYKERIGFNGVLMIEPKPKEPTKHQYDFDASTVLYFLKKHNLFEHFKLNIEANHATLAGHTFAHELRVARLNGKLGSIDANRGDLLLGWDTDQFPTDVYETTFAMYEVLENNGLDCGFNFDAKVRRASIDPEDIVYAHVSSMDAFALGLKLAVKLREKVKPMIEERYSEYNSEIGMKILEGKTTLDELSSYVEDLTDVRVKSLKQELLEMVINDVIFGGR